MYCKDNSALLLGPLNKVGALYSLQYWQLGGRKDICFIKKIKIHSANPEQMEQEGILGTGWHDSGLSWETDIEWK